MNSSAVFKKVTAVSKDDVGIDEVDASLQQVVRVDEVVGDAWVVGLDTHEQCPAEIENFSWRARSLPAAKPLKNYHFEFRSKEKNAAFVKQVYSQLLT